MKSPSAGLSGRSMSAGIMRGGRKLIQYLLGPFRFTTDAAAPLTSPYTEPGAVGSLTLVQNDGSFSISAGKLNVPTQATPAHGDLGLYSSAGLARVSGRTYLFQSNKAALTTYYPALVWDTAGRIGSPTGGEHALLFDISNSLLATVASVSVTVGVWAATTDYELLIILRSTGAFYCIKGGVFSTWTLLWVDASRTATPLYPVMTNYSGVATLDNLRVLDLGLLDARFATDFGLCLNRSTFTAANGTALTAITPEAGGVWTAQVGVFEVQSNKAKILTYVGHVGFVTVVSGSADVIAEVTINLSSTTSFSAGVVVRYTDVNNYWDVVIEGGNLFKIYEVNAGVQTARASSAFTLATATDYRIVVVVDGSTISAYINNGTKITYASAALNQTVARHGLVVYQATDVIMATFDDFAIFPRTLSLPGGI